MNHFEAHAPLGPERELLLLFARTRLDAPARERVDELLERPVDWGILASLALRHHTLPLLHYHLSGRGSDRVPADVQDELRSHHYHQAARSLKGINECRTILEALEAADAPGVVWKGPVLAHTVYPGPELRVFNDLDILVRRKDVTVARRVLEQRGYARVFGPDIPDDDLFGEANQDVTMGHPGSLMDIDLHWGTVRRYFSSAIDFEELWSEHGLITVNGHPVRALAMEPMVLALAVHGAKHGPHPWPALKWVTDMEAILHTAEGSEWSSILARADRLGCRRMLLLGLALAQDLLGAPVPPSVSLAIKKEAELVAIVSGIRERLLFPDGPTLEFAERLRFDLAVRERLGDRMRYRAARLLTPGRRDIAPGAVSFLRIPLRLARLGYRYVLKPRRARDFLLGRGPSRKPTDHR